MNRCHMSFQVPLLGKVLATGFTFEGFLIEMNVFVQCQCTHVLERFFTNVTLVCQLHMRQHVLPQLLPSQKALVTFLTREATTINMNFSMSLQFLFRDKVFVALLALEDGSELGGLFYFTLASSIVITWMLQVDVPL